MRSGSLMAVIVISLGGLLPAQETTTRAADFFLDVASRPEVLLPDPAGSTDGADRHSFGESRPFSGRAEGDKRPAVAVTLRGLDPPAPVFAWGDHFVYEVLVVNTGELPVALPWSPGYAMRRSATPAEEPYLRSGGLVLWVYSADGRDLLTPLVSQPLEGSEIVPGSLQRLLPGQSAILRVGGAWHPLYADRASLVSGQPEGQVRVKVNFSVHDQVQAESSNSLPVTIVPPIRPLR